MFVDEICGCKGIRTCLLCEKRNNPINQDKTEEVGYVFTYCPDCNLCWPDNKETAEMCDFPLYIGKIKLYQDFFSKEEEIVAVSAIDRIPWMASQSGRQKQDFGPKVNFKKKKVKIGEFKGFPSFVEDALRKFQEIPELLNFRPVELCHLEYSPDRGSSIDPHVDDFWLWGERLVTINLSSSTVLTLAPCSENTCDCFQEASSHDPQFRTFCREHLYNTLFCHMFRNILTINLAEEVLPVSNIISSVNDNYFKIVKSDVNNSVSITTEEKYVLPADDLLSNITLTGNRNGNPINRQSLQVEVLPASNIISSVNDNNYFKIVKSDVNNSASTTTGEKCVLPADDLLSNITLTGNPSPLIELNPGNCFLNDPKNYVSNTSKKSGTSAKLIDNDVSVGIIKSPLDQLNHGHSSNDRKNFCQVNAICNTLRNDTNKLKVAVRVNLPPRSLFVLAGCARYNWSHEIKRRDVVSRRLAMTFRELSTEFLENKFGKDLLEIASSFCDL